MSKENSREKFFEPKKNERVNLDKSKVVFFDPEKEVEYLEKISEENRYQALRTELITAMQEKFWVQGDKVKRIFENGRLKDPVGGCFLDEVSQDVDKDVFLKIQERLNNGQKLIFHFSPRNMDLDNKDNLVDVWINKGKGEVEYMRFFSKDGFGRFKEVYKYFGGDQEIENELDLLKNPLNVDDFSKMSLIMGNLQFADGKRSDINNSLIIENVDNVLRGSYEKCGKSLFKNGEEILRAYTLIERGIIGNIDVANYYVLEEFLYREISGRKESGNGGSCPGINMVTEFAPGRGMIVSFVDGSISFKEGNVDGLTFCKHCGYYYSGDKCPICN